jgi:hypothetical protein
MGCGIPRNLRWDTIRDCLKGSISGSKGGDPPCGIIDVVSGGFIVDKCIHALGLILLMLGSFWGHG